MLWLLYFSTAANETVVCMLQFPAQVCLRCLAMDTLSNTNTSLLGGSEAQGNVPDESPNNLFIINELNT